MNGAYGTVFFVLCYGVTMVHYGNSILTATVYYSTCTYVIFTVEKVECKSEIAAGTLCVSLDYSRECKWMLSGGPLEKNVC